MLPSIEGSQEFTKKIVSRLRKLIAQSSVVRPARPGTNSATARLPVDAVVVPAGAAPKRIAWNWEDSRRNIATSGTNTSGATPPRMKTDCQPNDDSMRAAARPAARFPTTTPVIIEMTSVPCRCGGLTSDTSAMHTGMPPPRPTPVARRASVSWVASERPNSGHKDAIRSDRCAGNDCLGAFGDGRRLWEASLGGNARLTDFFMLLKTDGRWLITHKTFHWY